MVVVEPQLLHNWQLAACSPGLVSRPPGWGGGGGPSWKMLQMGEPSLWKGQNLNFSWKLQRGKGACPGPKLGQLQD